MKRQSQMASDTDALQFACPDRLDLSLESRSRHFLCRFVPAFPEFLDHLLVERRNIIGLAACDQAVVHDDFFIHPTRSSVAHIGLNRWPRSHLSPANEVGADQYLRPVTNCCDRFAFAEEMARKFERVFVRTQRLRIKQAAGKHERIKFLRSRIGYGKIDIEL